MANQKTPAPSRPTHIEGLGEIPWGTHCCLLYESFPQLTDILVNYFKAGLESNEYCLWITSGVVSEQAAKKALLQASAYADAPVRKGQLQIRPATDSHSGTEESDLENALDRWVQQAEQAIESGYEGLRLAGDLFTPSLLDSRKLVDYTSRFGQIISDRRIIALNIYPLSECTPADIAHLTSRHKYSLISSNDGLEVAVTPAHQKPNTAPKAGRELFRSMVDSNPDALYIIDANEHIQFANTAGQSLLEGSNDQLSGQRFTLPYDCDKTIETELKWPDGKAFTGEIRAVRTHWKNASDVLVTIQDMSGRKTTELLLEKQQQELSAIYENTPTPILLVDKDRKIRKANAAALKAAGRDYDDMLGTRGGEALRCIHALDDPRGCGFGEACEKCAVRNTIMDTYNAGTPHKQVAAEITLNDTTPGKHYDLWVSTIPLELGERMVLVCLEDVTELKQVLKSLSDSEARLKSIFQAAPVGIGTLVPETDNGNVTSRVLCDINESLCQITGYPESELKGKEARLLYASQQEYERIGRELYSQIKAANTGKAESRLKRKDGRLIDIQLSAAPLNPQDWTGGISFIIMDITQLKAAEAEQKKLESQLRQSQKMEAIGQLTGGIAHDFNNLLQIINGYGDMMTEEIGADHSARAALNEILNAGNRAAALVRQLLAFSRQQVMKMDDLYLNDLLNNLNKMIQRIIGEHIAFEFIPGHNLGRVHADTGQIEQVIINLCINARDAMPEGGKLLIETSNVFINGEYCDSHLEAQPGRYVLLCITDNGVGMNKETQERIFDPFFTTKDVDQGTGLGLSTVYGIIRQHGGTINVYSEPGQGTLFKIYLPVVERRAVEVGAEIPQKGRGGDESILIAEDDQMVRDLMKTILERGGYTIFTAANGEAAIETVKNRQSEIDLAILDVVMPGKSGKAVFDAIKQIKPSMPVLFASGYSENAIHTDFILDKRLELIQKPFAFENLLNKVRELLDRTE